MSVSVAWLHNFGAFARRRSKPARAPPPPARATRAARRRVSREASPTFSASTTGSRSTRPRSSRARGAWTPVWRRVSAAETSARLRISLVYRRRGSGPRARTARMVSACHLRGVRVLFAERAPPLPPPRRSICAYGTGFMKPVRRAAMYETGFMNRRCALVWL